jgi:DNA-binding transcriptional ArsR family regulator
MTRLRERYCPARADHGRSLGSQRYKHIDIFSFVDMSSAHPRSAAAPISVELVVGRARSLSDPRRVRILTFLTRGPATVSEIGDSLGLAPSETSRQLAVLRAGRLVRMHPRGRHRIYTTDTDLVRRILEIVSDGSPGSRPAPRHPSKGDDPRSRRTALLRRGRTCYDHLAGTVAVELAVAMERRGWLVREAEDFLVTQKGEAQLLERGVDMAICRDARRKLAPGCLDRTEQRPHIGGSLGAELLRCLSRSGYLEHGPGRQVKFLRPMLGWFGQSPDEEQGSPRAFARSRIKFRTPTTTRSPGRSGPARSSERH